MRIGASTAIMGAQDQLRYPDLFRGDLREWVRARTDGELAQLAAQIRRFLIGTVTRTGGHLGPNLGVVEISIALHRAFDSPRDVILFDTGHQAYVHKILTGRAAGFGGLRTRGGLAGYPSRAESAHDHIENSHASTVLSYADGIAKAHQLRGESGAVVAVVGDGALTGGLAWEGLNNLSTAADRPVIVVLNDNCRSYAPTIGGIAAVLASLRDGSPGANLFTAMGFQYLGPVDGHDEPAVERALRQAHALRRPVVVHCVTRKGFGYQPAERDTAEQMHAIGVLDELTGLAAAAAAPTWTEVFAEALCAVGADNPRLVAITAAMPGPTGLDRFGVKASGRMFDVGIAEQHALCSAAGLAMGGMHPVVAVYATFLNRAFDQTLLDVALHQLPVTIALDRAGITGPDGPSHHGMWDLAILGAVPGLRIAAPRDPASLVRQLREAVAWSHGPTVLRFPKATAGPDIPAIATAGAAEILLSQGEPDVVIVAIGVMAESALRAAELLTAEGIGVSVIDPCWVTPPAPELLEHIGRHRLAVTIEDGIRVGGAGSRIAQACLDNGITTPVHTIGLPTRFLEHGSRAELLATAGLTPAAIADTIRSLR